MEANESLLPTHIPLAQSNPSERIEVTLYLRAPSAANLSDHISQQVQQKSPPLSREEYAATQSATPEDEAKVEQFARERTLTVVSTDLVRRRMVLVGTAAAMSAAFATELHQYE